MSLRIVPATLEDAPLVYEITQQAFAEYIGILDPPPAVHTEVLEDVLHTMHEGGALLAYVDDVPAGAVRYAFQNDSCYIGRVSVLPAFRGQGIASAMVWRVEALARESGCVSLTVTVRLILETNVHLYERLGFRISTIYEHPKGGSMVADMRKPL